MERGEEFLRGFTKQWHPRLGATAGGGTAGSLVARVLAARGLSDPVLSARFLEPSLRHLHQPSLIPDLDRAAERILAAARSGEQIVIYGDYDVDGISATAILFHMIMKLAPGAQLKTYVPHRLDEGYGLNSEAMNELADAGTRVIVSVDCGVTATGPAEVAKARGVDLIITDHHNLPGSAAELPEAFAVVHPRRFGSAYPFGELCGAGVAYKLAWRMATMACGSERVTEPLRALLIELLALASLGVIADVVPLVDENRIIASFGLRRIKHSAIPGLRALVEASGLGGEGIDAEDVGFRLGPRLNACGRMGHAREAVEMLTTADRPRANQIAEELTRQNDLRRATERVIYEQAAAMAEQAGMTRDGVHAIVLAHPEWHAGVVGIVCSRLVERFHRPTILLAERDGMCHGSGRSIGGFIRATAEGGLPPASFDLHGALVECAPHLLQFGGHDMAAGMKLESAKLPGFVGAFTAVANRDIPPEWLVQGVSYDAEALTHELSNAVVSQLARLGPFGRDNPPVRLLLRGVRVDQLPQTFGSGNKHLGVVVRSTGAGAANGPLIRLVGWNWAGRIASVRRGTVLDALIVAKVSSYNGRVEGQIIDLRACPGGGDPVE